MPVGETAKCLPGAGRKRRYGGGVSKFLGFLLGVAVALAGPAVFGVLAAPGGIQLNAKGMVLAYGIGALLFWAVVSYFSGAAAIGAFLAFGTLVYCWLWIPNRTTNFLNDVPGVTNGMVEGTRQFTLNGVVPILTVISLVYAIQLIVRGVQRRRRARAEAERRQREQEAAQAQQEAAAAAVYPVAAGGYAEDGYGGSAYESYDRSGRYDDLFDEEPVRPRSQADEHTAQFPVAGAPVGEPERTASFETVAGGNERDETVVAPGDRDETVVAPVDAAVEDPGEDTQPMLFPSTGGAEPENTQPVPVQPSAGGSAGGGSPEAAGESVGARDAAAEEKQEGGAQEPAAGGSAGGPVAGETAAGGSAGGPVAGGSAAAGSAADGSAVGGSAEAAGESVGAGDAAAEEKQEGGAQGPGAGGSAAGGSAAGGTAAGGSVGGPVAGGSSAGGAQGPAAGGSVGGPVVGGSAAGGAVVGGAAGSGATPPVEAAPGAIPPVEAAPVATPPVEAAPGATPPAEAGPGGASPVEGSGGGSSPVVTPPVAVVPVEEPPVGEEPVEGARRVGPVERVGTQYRERMEDPEDTGEFHLGAFEGPFGAAGVRPAGA
ncbi:hypothetical protein GCM10009534_45580 [Kribbella sandramycini]